MKIVSQLDSDGFLIGTSTADESPLEPGVFLIPGGCVDTTPPEIPEGKRAKWEGHWVFEDIPHSDSDEKQPTQEELHAQWLQNAVVSMRQARLALLELDILDQVPAAIATIQDPKQKSKAEIEWEYATTVERNSTLVQMFSTQMGLTESQLDNLFTLASKL